MAGDWTAEENRTIVAVYLEMLDAELRGEQYVKADFNRKVARATGRTRGSVEYKFQNISSVMADLGLPWVTGYKPAKNYQNGLLREVVRQVRIERTRG